MKEGINMDADELLKARANFYKFFMQHDARRDTDFLATYPEMEDWWNICKEAEALNMKDLVDALQKDIVTVVFEKLDTGEIRTMPCTLNKEIHKQSIDIKKYDTNSDTIIMYALDKKAWRDVRVNTIKTGILVCQKRKNNGKKARRKSQRIQSKDD